MKNYTTQGFRINWKVFYSNWIGGGGQRAAVAYYFPVTLFWVVGSDKEILPWIP